ncbi:MAG TPA: helix-turn-helix domain-containing protein [Dehalococcoidia bacterium]|nr:helix-turn-helix domain-containing protein [Dehalococcoidia bacterium]
MSKLLTVAEVAERLRIHPMTVRRHIKSGKLRATRVGRSVRVPEDSLDEVAYTPAPARELTEEEWIARLLAPPSPEEQAKRDRAIEEMLRHRTPIDIPTGVLKRVSRRDEEVIYGDKTWDELIAEEMAYEEE